MASETIICKNCSDTVAGNFCSNCGQAAKVKRVDYHYLSHEVQHMLHFEKGFLYTVKELAMHPGQNIREFIAGGRPRLVKPILFLIITSVIYTIIVHYFHIKEGLSNYDAKKAPATAAIFTWVQNNYGYANIIMGMLIALWIKMFFRRSEYNFFEILILLCFVMGMGMLISAIFALVQGLTKFELIQSAGYLGIIYCSWAIGEFFGRTRTINYLKSILAYMFGVISFTLVALIVGTLLDVVFKR